MVFKQSCLFCAANMDDDSGLLDFIGDTQELNFFWHGSADELTSTSLSAPNTNSIFNSASHADSKSSIRGVHNQSAEGHNDGLQPLSSLHFLDDELETSPIHDINEDQPFDILQKSLQVANITEQTLAEEAYLDSSVVSSQQFATASVHSHSSSSFAQATSIPNYSGQTVHSVGVTHMPLVQQQVGTSFVSNTVGVQHGFMQHVGIIPSQHMPSSNQNSSGQIHLIGSINNQPPVMAINNIDGSQIILKSGQQIPSNSSGGSFVRHNGNAMFGSPDSSPAGHPVTVPSCGSNFQTSLPVHNIIIHRGSVPNANKMPINIQPKPIQAGQIPYNVNHLGMQQHHVHHSSANSPQNSAVSQQLPIHQQGHHKPIGQQPGSSIVIHSPMGQAHGHTNQFVIPAGLSVNSNPVQHIQSINTQLVQTQTAQLGPHQVSADHVMLSRNIANMVRPSQPYSGQMLNSQGTAVQLISGQTFAGHNGQFIVNHGTSHIVGGQMSQVSPTVLHLSPSPSNNTQSRSTFSSLPHSNPNMSSSSHFTVLSSGTVLQSMGPSFHTSTGGEHFTGDQQQSRSHSGISEAHVQASTDQPANIFNSTSGSQHTFSCGQAQKEVVDQVYSVSSLNTQENSRQHQLCTTTLAGHNSGSKQLHTVSTARPQESIAETQLRPVEVGGCSGRMEMSGPRQLRKASLILQRLHKDQEHAVFLDKTPFGSLNNAAERLLPYHVFQGSLPTDEDLKKVDNEFESASIHLLKKTQSMLNKYRLLLLEDAMRINPSAEVVMLDRIFNQEERATLTCEKRCALVDPDGYLAEFCCSSKYQQESMVEKLLTDLDSNETVADPSQKVRDKKDQTDLTESSKNDSICLVSHNIKSQMPNASSLKKEEVCNDGKLNKIGASPRKHQLNIYREKTLLGDGCSQRPSGLCKVSTDNSKGLKRAKLTFEGTMEAAEEKCPQVSTPGPSAQNDKPSILGQTDPNVKSLMHSSKTNAMDQKLSEKHLENKHCGSNSKQTKFWKSSPTASNENSGDKSFSDTRGSVSETDSVLEAAVNSILEC
ncbi:BRD4-interacting chromatin-remodeling complex-associated protein-like isoform X2 [Xenopus laevis]|uniref:BRD4-interacting chromatin-remodeling complex-associated protein-like isoform X2 n=2 Tax=Xenopus laevis TaxID=8355 RepID=A0A8J0VES2_XENLA|nr:BRD4-interacting chromatin-remodeling complex-associated protein-like isoform X2 [Xenopus laevis]